MNASASGSYAEKTFRAEYARLNAEVYFGGLPAFPGLRLRRMPRSLGMTHVRGSARGRALLQFTLNPLAATARPLLLDTIRHEIAHAGAFVLDADAGHGARWKRHAVMCGARPERYADASLLPRRAPERPECCVVCDLTVPYAQRIGAPLPIGARRCRTCRTPLPQEVQEETQTVR